jgi:hypothetical protein
MTNKTKDSTKKDPEKNQVKQTSENDEAGNSKLSTAKADPAQQTGPVTIDKILSKMRNRGVKV